MSLRHLRPIGKGVQWVRLQPLQATEVYFIVDQRFGRLQLGTLLKDRDDQQCRSLWFAAANPVNNMDFQLSLFLFFLNIDIIL